MATIIFGTHHLFICLCTSQSEICNKNNHMWLKCTLSDSNKEHFYTFWFHQLENRAAFIYSTAWPKKLSFRFKSANCSVMIWGCFSWSGLGTASQQSSWMSWMTRLSHQFFLGHIPGWQCQDSSGSSCERVEHEDTWVSGSTRSHFHTWIGHHRVLTLTPH